MRLRHKCSHGSLEGTRCNKELKRMQKGGLKDQRAVAAQHMAQAAPLMAQAALGGRGLAQGCAGCALNCAGSRETSTNSSFRPTRLPRPLKGL